MLYLSRTSIQQLRRYIDGELRFDELYEWLLSAEYDESMSQEERATLSQLRAVGLEVADGLASPVEFDHAIITLVQTLSGSTLCGGGSTDIRDGSTTSWSGISWDTAETAEAPCDLLQPAQPATSALVSTAVTREPADQLGRILVGSPQ
jgi:hypothetical protein